jgi:hypothetical protein
VDRRTRPRAERAAAQAYAGGVARLHIGLARAHDTRVDEALDERLLEGEAVRLVKTKL